MKSLSHVRAFVVNTFATTFNLIESKSSILECNRIETLFSGLRRLRFEGFGACEMLLADRVFTAFTLS